MVELSVEGRLIKLREMADEYAQLLEMEKPIDHGSVDIGVMWIGNHNLWSGKIFPSVLILFGKGNAMTHDYHGATLEELLTNMETSYSKELENARKDLFSGFDGGGGK